MILTTVYVIEIIAVMQCIYCVYGKKMHINIPLVVTMAAVLLMVNVSNWYGATLESTVIMYGIFVLYCFLTFRKGLKDTIISTALFMTVIVLIQFVSQYLMYCITQEKTIWRTLGADLLSLIFCIFLLPRFEIYKIRQMILKKNVLFYLLLGYLLSLAGIILVQAKTAGHIRAELFLFTAPVILLVFLVCRQQAFYQTSYEEKEKEVQLYKEDREKFRGLAANVRLKQHELNNHIMAMKALHYTNHTYEDLVRAQESYAEQIQRENKYNSLLLLYNSTLPGFLYDKFKAIELRGVEINCRVSVKNYASVIPEYYLIEMLGILLDNAAEAVSFEMNKMIQLEIAEYEEEYVYIVRNVHPYVPNDEIYSWFQFGNSTKGTEHGLGLYHLKCTCQDWGCSAGCRNVSIEDQNWIEFRVGTGRKA